MAMSIKLPIVIDDKLLIQWAQANAKGIPFIKERQYAPEKGDRILCQIAQLDPKKPLYLQKEVLVTDIWRDLIGKAIVYLKSQDEREEYHDSEDYGVQLLYDFFDAFRKFEKVLYGVGEYYRDHICHMLRVFLSGELLIRAQIGFDKIAVSDKSLDQASKLSATEKEAMWCIMSLTHDLGYGLGKLPELSKRGRDMLQQFGILNIQDLSYSMPPQPLHDFMIRFISSDLAMVHPQPKAKKSFLAHIQPKYYLKFTEAFERRDHGIVSCLVLMKNLVYFLETDFAQDVNKPLDEQDAKQYLIRRNILRPIACHSCDNIYYLKLPDFAFLLTLFDEMQEWDRPRLLDLFTANKPVTRLTIRSLTLTEVTYRLDLEHKGTFTPDEQTSILKNADDYFQKKSDKIRKILRSAVGGRERALKLTFEVYVRLDGKISKKYKIVHETPEAVTVIP